MIGDTLAWLAKLLAGEKVKQHLNERSLNQQIRVLTKALDESQSYRQEYADALERVQRIAADRDHYHREMMRLRIELARQAAEIEKLREKPGGAPKAPAKAKKP